MANLNNKILWTPCCSNSNSDLLDIENPVFELTNDPFFRSQLESSFFRYFNYCYRKNFIDSIVKDYLDDFLRSEINIASSSGSENEEPSTNANSDDQKGENEEPSTNDNSDDQKGENEEPSTNDNSDDSRSQNGRPSTNDNSDDSRSTNGSPSPFWNDNPDDRRSPNGSPSWNDNSDDSRSTNGSAFLNDNSDDSRSTNGSASRIWTWCSEDTNSDNSPSQNARSPWMWSWCSTDDDSYESRNKNNWRGSFAHRNSDDEEPSTNERKIIDFSALWVQCETCYGINYKKYFFKERLNICEHCGCHLRIDSPERIELSIDPGTWYPMDEAGKEDSIDPGTRDPMYEEAGKEDSIDPGTRDPMDEAGKEEEDMLVLDPIGWDSVPESEDEEDEEDEDDEKDEWNLDSDFYSYSDPDPNTDPEEEEESEESDEEESAESDEEDPEESDEEDPEEEDPGEEEPEEEEWESDEEESDEEYPKESDEEDPDAEDRKEWGPYSGFYFDSFDSEEEEESEEEQKKEESDPEEEEDWSWLYIEEEKVEVEDKPYIERLFSAQDETELSEAIQTGIGQINGIPVAIGVMDFRFIGGSMGSVVGEKITRLIEYATNQILPLILVCASGGARMYEGSLSLMQMAKISAALYDYKLNKKSFYISILTTPTTGGVTASFGMLGDIIISEPDAYIAFAGKRVIEQTLNIEVPEGSQTAEVLFENGLLDLIVPRNPLKGVLDELLQLHNFCPLNKK